MHNGAGGGTYYRQPGPGRVPRPGTQLHTTLWKGGNFMRSVKTKRRTGAALLAVLLLCMIVFTAAAGAVEMPRREGSSAGESLSGGSEGPGGQSGAGDSMMSDPMMGSDMMGDTGDNLGDTAPGDDSWIGENDGVIDGTSGEASDGTGTQDTATDTAGTSSGDTADGGMSVFGIVITVVIILAVVALIIALIPKKRTH